MVARVTLIDLLGNAVVTRVGPEVIVREGRISLRILVLRQEFGAERDFIELHNLPQVAAEVTNVSHIQHRAETDFPLNSEVDLIGGNRLGVWIDVAREGARRKQARGIRSRGDGSVIL